MMLYLPATIAQVSNVEFGRNRLQYKKLKWDYYQSLNFNSYYYENGEQLAKYVLQIAEEELPGMERFIEYSLQRRANVVIYNTYDDMTQTNIGQGIDWENAGGTTKLVNNKMVVYFNGNHADLRRQVREGIAKILVQNMLFGDDLGEMAGNQALLDLPEWLTDGYIAYAAENWNTALDDDLKSEILSYKYKKFNQLVFERPLLAGHAFWYYIEEKYGRENTTYLLYLARIYKSLNRAAQQVAKTKKFNNILEDFMVYQDEKYESDIRKRRNYPKGSEVTSVVIGKYTDYFHFNVNPNKRNSSFAVVQYKKGQYKLVLDEDGDTKVLLKFGVRNRIGDINPNYPMMAWDPKGNMLAVIYQEEGRLKLFVFDAITRVKPYKRDLTEDFDQIQDVKYIYNSQTLVLSAVKNGQTDIFTYDIENEKVKQITNDVYDDLDPSFVAFPNKNGIMFSSNRPSADDKGSDTSLMKNRFNIFMVTNFAPEDPELNQITQLTNLEFGDARYPAQYNDNHFTFLNDANGVMNRYAGFFTTKAAGADTLVRINNEILRNPTPQEVDSVLRFYNKDDVDTIAVVALSEDSAYVFPLTNYASNIRETRAAGENNQVSEVTRQSDEKSVYKLKIDENTLKRRNVSARPTTYIQRLMEQRKLSEGEDVFNLKEQEGKPVDIFQQEFEVTEEDTAASRLNRVVGSKVLSTAKQFPYKPLKFSADYLVAGFNNEALGTRYEPYQGGSGPITLSSNNGFNGMIRLGVSDLMEDIRVSGGVRLSSNLKDNDWLVQFSNMRRRVDWGLLYYRRTISGTTSTGYPGKMNSNLYQGSVSYPFDEVRSVRVTLGFRSDKTILSSVDTVTMKLNLEPKKFGLMRAEYVYDNTLNPVMNIWDGVRYKVYTDLSMDMGSKNSAGESNKVTFNVGFDARGYYRIYRNFIWAGRVAGDFSWGEQKFIYYLGGIDNWMMLSDNMKFDRNTGKVSYRYFNPNNRPDPDAEYAYQSLAVNLRGFIQNAANGNNAIVINSEFRLPVFSTIFSKPINNAFLRNFQLTQFIDLGSAWNGQFDKIGRPTVTYSNPADPNTVQVLIKAPGVGPFLGGYGFGARSMLLGYFVKVDAGWPMNGFFKGKPIWYFSLGLDF
ncbi:MAG: hypothetical protein J5I50_04270 [Chitinophagaceae bacterium]|nr:hypothetical protein [Chitinophagaceae bacterium]